MNSDELNITSIQIYVYMVSNIPLQKGLNIHKNAFFNNICNSHRIKKHGIGDDTRLRKQKFERNLTIQQEIFRIFQTSPTILE